ncbi:hypothetical protein L210DRAFT_952517 [Boletus edulis BED1]|uniref:Uncharacterized protein n=1 Tax=Boletus edulis BED1 TaxID=1328754 RepID=A0AAD4C885_BOLED|nr:hypothetical protein L210DRAFT_952517 [Boletus edulis BED1]
MGDLRFTVTLRVTKTYSFHPLVLQLTDDQFSWTTAPDQRRVRGPACCYSKPQCYEIATRSTDCASLFQVRRRLNVPEMT